MTSLHRSHLGARLAGLVAVALAAAAGLVGLTSSPAAAAVCQSSGITAVVDASGAGGGVSSACDGAPGSRTAAAVFRDVNVSVTRNRDGSVCQVDAKPAGATCQGLGTKYWALFWSNGKDGRWVYSQRGDASLTIPQDGSVAWAWQQGSGQRQPGIRAPVVKPTPTKPPTSAPTKKPRPTRAPTKKPTKVTVPTRTPAGASTAAPTTRPSATVSASALPSASASTPASSSASASTAPPGTTDTTSGTTDTTPDASSTQATNNAFTPEEEHSGLPAWVPISVVIALAGAAGGTVWWRRSTGSA